MSPYVLFDSLCIHITLKGDRVPEYTLKTTRTNCPKDTKRVFKKCTNLLGTLAYSSFQWVMREKAAEATMCLSSRLFCPVTDATTFACPWREMQRPMLFQKSYKNVQQLQSLPFLLGRMLYVNPNRVSVKYWGRLINVTLNYSLKVLQNKF